MIHERPAAQLILNMIHERPAVQLILKTFYVSIVTSVPIGV